MKKNNEKNRWFHHDRPHELFRPVRDWYLLLILGALGLILMFGLYLRLERELQRLADSRADATPAGTTARFTREEVIKYASGLKERQTKFELLQKTPRATTDPSI